MFLAIWSSPDQGTIHNFQNFRKSIQPFRCWCIVTDR